MYLTKSKIQKYKQCQKQLWLSENKSTLDKTSDISKIIMDQGSTFGSLIKNNFSNVYDIKVIIFVSIYVGRRANVSPMSWS